MTIVWLGDQKREGLPPFISAGEEPAVSSDDDLLEYDTETFLRVLTQKALKSQTAQAELTKRLVRGLRVGIDAAYTQAKIDGVPKDAFWSVARCSLPNWI